MVNAVLLVGTMINVRLMGKGFRQNGANERYFEISYPKIKNEYPKTKNLRLHNFCLRFLILRSII